MKRVISALLLCLLLTGCWDQHKLKKMLFADVIGLDYEGDSKELKVSFVISALENAHFGGGTLSNLFIASKGKNIYDAADHTNKETPGILSVLETRLFLISNQFAKDRPLDYLNITGQFNANPLYGYLALYDGDLTKLLAKKKLKGNMNTSEFLVGLLDDEKKRGKIPSTQLIRYILGGAEFLNDFALNRFESYEDSPRLSGTALFSDGKYTGINLNDSDTLLAVLMNGTEGQLQPFIGNIDGNTYTVLVRNVSRNFHFINYHDSLSEIKITLKLDVKLIEYGLEMKQHTNEMLMDLEKKIAEDLTARATHVITTLQQANCDYLQLGHEVAAYHPKQFKDIDWWREQYPRISIKPTVEIKINNTGVLE